MRSERTRDRILPHSTYDLVEKAVMEKKGRKEDPLEGVEHIVVLSGVPVVFPTVRDEAATILSIL